MKLKNVLFVVRDIEESKAFYRELFGLEVVNDFGENVILTEGLVLQEQKQWEKWIDQEVVSGGNDTELYFEENDLDVFLEKLENSRWKIKYMNCCMEQDWGQRVIRMYDLDYHMIEIRESMEYVIRRYLKLGMSCGEVARKTQYPLGIIEEISNIHERLFE